MSFNYIWQCKLQLKQKNTNLRSKEAFLYNSCISLLILNENKEPVWSKTNISVVNRTIAREANSKLDYTNIDKIIPIKNLGRSLAND